MLSIPPSWKVTFPVTLKPTPPTVFNLQALDWVHCEEEMHAYFQISQHTNKKFFYFIWRFFYFAKKNANLKKIDKIYYPFFFTKRYSGIHIYLLNALTSNFSISLKSYEEQSFPWVPQNAYLFSMTVFFMVDRKSSWTKTFSQNMIYMFCL